MFSYVDPSIHRLLVEQGKIVTLGDEPDASEDDVRPRTGRIKLLGPIPMPVHVAGVDVDVDVELRWYPFVRSTEHEHVLQIAAGLDSKPDLRALWQLLTAQMTVNSILVYGDFEQAVAPLVRVHSCCMTGEVFGSQRCECGPQLHDAFRRIVDEGRGAVVYMAGHEGRGIGLWAKGITYLLQDMGRTTYDANRDLGLPADSRDFRDAAVVLRHFLREPKVRLLSNNPLKRADLESNGIEVVSIERLVVGVTEHNLRYMHAKREHGHSIGGLPDEEGGSDDDERC